MSSIFCLQFYTSSSRRGVTGIICRVSDEWTLPSFADNLNILCCRILINYVFYLVCKFNFRLSACLRDRFVIFYTVVMSDAWSDIQALKNKQNSLREKLAQRKKQRQEVVAEIIGKPSAAVIKSGM